MSTEPRLAGQLPNQHGLSEEQVDEHFDQLIAEAAPGHVAAVVLLQPRDAGTSGTADGRKRWVKYEIVRLEVPTGADQHRARDLILAGHAARVGGTVLPLDWTSKDEADQKSILLERALDWAERSGLELTERWYERYDRQHVPEPKNASLTQLRDFCIDMNILDPAEDVPGDHASDDEPPLDDDEADE